MPAHRIPTAVRTESAKVGSRKYWVGLDVEGHTLTTFRSAAEARAWEHRVNRTLADDVAYAHAANETRAALVRAYLVRRAARALDAADQGAFSF